MKFVEYVIKNQIGLVKRPNGRGGYFVWYHLGGTAASTPVDIIEPITSLEDILEKEYSNQYVRDSLLERYLRMVEGNDTSDLIDRDDIRPDVVGEFTRLWEVESSE